MSQGESPGRFAARRAEGNEGVVRSACGRRFAIIPGGGRTAQDLDLPKIAFVSREAGKQFERRLLGLAEQAQEGGPRPSAMLPPPGAAAVGGGEDRSQGSHSPAAVGIEECQAGEGQILLGAK